MKQVSVSRLLKSIVLLLLASTFLSFAFTGDPAQIALPIMGILFLIGFVKGLLGIQSTDPKGSLLEAIVLSDTTYAGEAAEFMLTKAVIGADTFNKGVINVKDGIKKQYTIPRVDVSGIMQKRAAIPVSQGAVTVDGQTLVPRDLMLYFEFNPRDFESHWYAKSMEKELIEAELPPTIENYMTLMVMLRLNEFFENAYWKSRISFDPAGAAVNPTSKGQAATDVQYLYFDGFITKCLNSAKTIKVGSPVVLTAANIRAQFLAAYNLVPQALLFKYGAQGLRFFVSYADQQKYEEALTSDAYKNNDTTEKGVNRYKGYDVVPLAGLPENTFFVGIGRPDQDGNFWVGMNSQDDETALQMAKLQANAELYFIKGLFKMDTQVGFFEQVVMYSTITA